MASDRRAGDPHAGLPPLGRRTQRGIREAHTIDAGGYYFVEPGDTHTETALVDTQLLVICVEDRPEFRRQP
ncbi:hypothetical protein NZK32_11245 [Cyanobium sp. FGCU-52]|nr:hypothetical protein [Cyanobium sp. FGCU52]